MHLVSPEVRKAMYAKYRVCLPRIIARRFLIYEMICSSCREPFLSMIERLGIRGFHEIQVTRKIVCILRLIDSLYSRRASRGEFGSLRLSSFDREILEMVDGKALLGYAGPGGPGA